MKPMLEYMHYSKIAAIREAVKQLVLSAPAAFDDRETERITARAVERFNCIETNGLKVCRHPSGELRGFVLTSLDFDPYTIGRHIGSAVQDGFHVNASYYGERNTPRAIDYDNGFTNADRCSVFFVVRAANISRMPGHNPSIPGSICANMKWGKERDEKFATFVAEFAATGEAEIRAVNALSHGLIYLHDLRRNLYKTTLGKIGHIDYIQQFYDAEAGLCPYGDVKYGEPRWSARGAGARLRCAAVCLAR